MDWKEMLRLSPREMSEDQKDELCQSLKWLDIDIDGLNLSKLKVLFRLVQEILRYKDEQVEMLITEFDEIAKKQGIEEAKIIQSLENEIKLLKSSNESHIHTPDTSTIKDNENLKHKIKNLKSNIKTQAQEIDQLKRDILILQEEKNLLQSELQNVQHENDSQSESSEISEKHQHLTENIKQKNKHISQLLNDIEMIEKENIVLKERIVTLRDDLNEATGHISTMTTEISGQKTSLQECGEKMTLLSEETFALRNQIQEMVQQKNERESEIESFTAQLDLKVDELKVLLEEKQVELKQVKEENNDLKQRVSNYTDDVNKIPLTIILEKEEQISELQSKLIEATKEIEQNTILLKNISESRKPASVSPEYPDINEDLKHQLEKSHERCHQLQKMLESTEQDAQNHGQQLAELMNQLQKYEEGQYGLTDAIKEIQDCKVQINVRDKQIAKLIQESNKLQTNCDEIEQENLALREKLGLPLDAPVSKNGIISKHRKQKKLINNLQNQIEILEDEKLQIKVDFQKLKRQLSEPEQKSETEKKSETQVDNSTNRTEIKELKEENEALRKGLHEILESIREKKGSSIREIKSESLEQLLHVLDARHVTGWYHPAMKLQAEVNTLQGTNEELRNQLKLYRSEVHKGNEQLIEAERKLVELQNKVMESTEKLTTIDGNLITNLVVPPNISTTSADIISKLNSHLLIVLNEYHSEMEVNDKLKDKLEMFKQEINVIRQQIGLLYKQHLEEKKILTSKYEEAKTEKETLSKSINSLEDKLEKYIKSYEIENIGQKLSTDLISLNRKCLYLEENEKKLSSENVKLKQELCNAHNMTSEYVKDLEISQNNLMHKLSILEKTLRDCVPKNKLDLANKTINDLTVKYRKLLHIINDFQENNNIVIFKKEIELLNSEKDKLFFELLQLKSKAYLTEHANDEIVMITKKLANYELNELSERQRADHINSLYELVKEQLKKCEERCTECENQNKLLISANLKQQLLQQELQDKLINYVSNEQYESTNEKLRTVKEDLHNLKNKYDKLQTKYSVVDSELKTKEMLKSSQTMELMNLKHLLLDLQSSSDEKALIARLSTEVVLARICESDAKNRVDILTNEMQLLVDDRKLKDVIINENFVKMSSLRNTFQLRHRMLEQIIMTLRAQYLGFSPLYTQERIKDMLYETFKDKQNAFNELQFIQNQKNDIIVLQEQLNVEMKNTLELKSAFVKQKPHSAFEKLLEWHRDKNTFQLNEFKNKRNLAFKEHELDQALQRINMQDNQIIQLEEELLKSNNNYLSNLNILSVSSQSSDSSRRVSLESVSKTPIIKFVDFGTDVPDFDIRKVYKSIETQTSNAERNKQEEIILTLQEEIKQLNELISLKENNLQRQQLLIEELEINFENIKEQLSEKENQRNDSVSQPNRSQINVIDEVDMDEFNLLKEKVTKLQQTINEKEDMVDKYETMLKERKDEHSLAASRFQEEIKQLQNTLEQQHRTFLDLKATTTTKSAASSNEIVSNKTVIEQYVSQVHTLEAHMAELQTSVSSLNSQLQASRQESVRWRTLANDRLNSIENLRKEFDEQHVEEIEMYKTESQKYKEENISLKQEMSKFRVELNQKSSTSNQEMQEKETKIHELTLTVMQLKNELKICKEDENIEMSPEFSQLELTKQLLESEHEALKKRYEQIVNREKNARDEIKKLKAQLIKRPILSIRSDKNDRSVKEQLQKKISQLEKDLVEANSRLDREAQFSEARRLKAAEDFTQWEKIKKWQHSAEKLKTQLTAKVEEMEKLQQSYNSAKAIISRLEREKHILEGRLKSAKTSTVSLASVRIETCEQENMRLKTEVDTLTAKLEMQQYHSGGLGAAMLQEKLEAQERKIAVLEVSAKGTAEVTGELERLHNTIATLQKANLRLEAQNLEMSLDLKKATVDNPYHREQIQHLERYIDVLKSEQSEHHVTSSGDHLQPGGGGKKVAELEKTVLSLKRLVEKLQTENKRLQSRPCSSNADRKVTNDKYKAEELKKVREQYTESVQRSTKLEDELTRSQKRVRFLENIVGDKLAEDETSASLSTQMAELKAQLDRKTQLLDKVKILLQKAAIKERFLLDQVEQLKALVPSKTDTQAMAESLADELIEESNEDCDDYSSKSVP